jgi:Fur family transcriptional regulator, stress-responsive regulator
MSKEAREAAAALLREHSLRVTPQRRAIWAAFEHGAAGHLSADAILRRARRELPELSRATVYNALNEFVAAGLLHVVEHQGVQLYDPNVASHHHFRCRSCNHLFDVHPTGLGRLKLPDEAFDVEETQILFTGLCGDCR